MFSGAVTTAMGRCSHSGTLEATSMACSRVFRPCISSVMRFRDTPFTPSSCTMAFAKAESFGRTTSTCAFGDRNAHFAASSQRINSGPEGMPLPESTSMTSGSW